MTLKKDYGCLQMVDLVEIEDDSFAEMIVQQSLVMVVNELVGAGLGRYKGGQRAESHWWEKMRQTEHWMSKEYLEVAMEALLSR